MPYSLNDFLAGKTLLSPPVLTIWKFCLYIPIPTVCGYMQCVAAYSQLHTGVFCKLLRLLCVCTCTYVEKCCDMQVCSCIQILLFFSFFCFFLLWTVVFYVHVHVYMYVLYMTCTYMYIHVYVVIYTPTFMYIHVCSLFCLFFLHST